MDAAMLDRYRGAWRRHLGAVIDSFEPDLIHAHHVWIVSSMLRDVAGSTPIVVQCHGTGLRQMELCPHLAEEVRMGCARADHFQVLREDHVAVLRDALGIDGERVSIVPAGFREDLFHARVRGRGRGEGRRLLYVGKYSAAKGLPQLLDAMDALVGRAGWGDVRLDVAGSGSGAEADALRLRMESMQCVTLHGQLDQPDLAALMRECDVCVLPSFYEGVPLVLVEAAACGCRLVATALPGVVGALAPALGDRLELVAAPPMAGVDTPRADGVADFTRRLGVTLERALAAPAGPLPGPTPGLSADPALGRDLASFGWGAVFERVRAIWTGLLPPPPTGPPRPSV